MLFFMVPHWRVLEYLAAGNKKCYETVRKICALFLGNGLHLPVKVSLFLP
jgi:hypothetical protein